MPTKYVADVDEAEGHGPGTAAKEDTQGDEEHPERPGQHHADQAEQGHDDTQAEDEAVRALAGDDTEDGLHKTEDELHDSDAEADVFIGNAAVLTQGRQQDADIRPQAGPDAIKQAGQQAEGDDTA